MPVASADPIASIGCLIGLVYRQQLGDEEVASVDQAAIGQFEVGQRECATTAFRRSRSSIRPDRGRGPGNPSSRKNRARA